jgi:23S rRNA pseudouridine2457 synthase
LKSPALHYILFYKPYGVLSQFTGGAGQKTLSDFGPFPPDVYPVGRLDADSEGLVLLTNDNRLKHRMLDPRFGHPRTYLVQVERKPSSDSAAKLQHGVIIEGRRTRPARVEILGRDPDLPPRSKPIRFRKTVPTAWLRLTLTEGRNRQVRKMTASVGHPTLRIVRTGLGPLSIKGLPVGGFRELTTGEIANLVRSLQSSRQPGRFQRPAHNAS